MCLPYLSSENMRNKQQWLLIYKGSTQFHFMVKNLYILKYHTVDLSIYLITPSNRNIPFYTPTWINLTNQKPYCAKQRILLARNVIIQKLHVGKLNCAKTYLSRFWHLKPYIRKISNWPNQSVQRTQRSANLIHVTCNYNFPARKTTTDSPTNSTRRLLCEYKELQTCKTLLI